MSGATPPRAPRVVLAGGGPAAAVAALVLARRGVAATVLEASSGPVRKAGETLPPSLAPLLRHLGLEDALAADGHLRSHGNRACWGSPEPAESPFVANPHGAGWHVDRRRFEARLAAAAQRAGARWRWGCRAECCDGGPGGWRLEVSTSPGSRRELLEADFVADATGRHARLARRLGARRLRYDRLVGVFGLLEGSIGRAPDGWTLVEAVPDGWWYTARLADGRLAACLFGDGDLLPRPLLGCAPEAWWRRLRRTTVTRRRVEGGGYALAGPLRVLPAASSRLDVIAGDGWLALGDAAAAYDPLSSHGVASAMGSGYYAGHAIADTLAGRPAARDAYLAVMQRTYATYLDLLRTHYARERRWPDDPFWRRRQEEAFTRAA